MLDRLFPRRRGPVPAFQDMCDRIARMRDVPPAMDYAPLDRQRDFRTVFRTSPAGRRVLAQIL